IRLVKDYVGITTGLGITYNSYGLDDNVRVISNSDSTYGFMADRNLPDSLGGFTSFTKNKLRTTYVRVPLLLEFNTSLDPKRTVHVAAGVTGGVRIGSINKIKYEEDGKNVKQRTKDDFNFSPFTLDASVRIGYKNFTLFANYGLTPLFEDGKGAEVYPLTVGLTLIPWSADSNID
ncbi:MAG: outer membrane beta-barrel protein, partial [Flavobacteriales bacterium]